MAYKLYSDSLTWHKEYSADLTTEEIVGEEGIQGTFEVVGDYGETLDYVTDSGFEFSIRTVNE